MLRDSSGKRAIFAGVLAALVTSFAPAARGEPPAGDEGVAPPLVLTGATLVDGTGAPAVPDAVVVIRDGRFECAGRAEKCDAPAGARVLHLPGRWLTPGVVDAHVHFSQTGWADGRPDAIDVRALYPYAQVQARLESDPDRYFRAYLCSGVTSVFDVGGFPWTWGLRVRGEKDHRAPQVAAAGPLISHVNPPQVALPAEQQFIALGDEEAGRAGVRYLAANDSDAVKLWFLAPEELQRAAIDARVRAVAAEAAAAGLPLIVHATSLREARVAVDAGARVLVHSVGDQEVDDAFVAALLEREVIYTPTLTVRGGYLRMYEAAYTGVPPEVDDPNRCVDRETLEKVASSGELGAYLRPERSDYERFRDVLLPRFARERATEEANLRKLWRAGVTIAMGTDAGNPLTLHGPSIHAEMEAMQAAGMPAADVLVASTLNAATAMGRGAQSGSVEAGKVADLLVLVADPLADIANMRRMETVVRNGQVLDQSSLRRDPR